MEHFFVTSRTISFWRAPRGDHLAPTSECVSAEELEGQCPVRRLSCSARKTLLNSVLGETSEDLHEFLHCLCKTRCQRSGQESAAGCLCLMLLSSALLPTVPRTGWREQREICSTVRSRISGVIFTTPKIWESRNRPGRAEWSCT